MVEGSEISDLVRSIDASFSELPEGWVSSGTRIAGSVMSTVYNDALDLRISHWFDVVRKKTIAINVQYNGERVYWHKPREKNIPRIYVGGDWEDSIRSLESQMN